MKNTTKMTITAGFTPLLCFIAFLLLERLADQNGAWQVILWQTVPFIVPCILIGVLGKLFSVPVMPPLCRAPRKSAGFTVVLSFAVFFLSLLVNFAFAALAGESYYRTIRFSSEISVSPVFTILCMVVLPAIFEELFFRGMFLRALGQGGTAVAVFLSALCFAVCHGDVRNVAGPFVAGLVYGYMVTALGSVWPAVFAHLLNNGCSLAVAYLTKAYEALGLWSYVLIAIAAAFLLCTAIGMTLLERLVEKGKIKRFLPAATPQDKIFTLFTPGVVILAVVFIVRAFIK